MSNINKQAHKMRNYLNTAVISGVKLLHLTTDELSALLDELEATERRIAELESERDKQGRHACELFDEVTSQRQQIAELLAAGIITKVGE